ncbi:MAG: hypothetical protein QXT86_08440 [Archaeoglobaceae archaeon]
MNDEKQKILAIIYFTLIILSLIIYNNRENLYIRPEAYFYILSIAASLIFLQIITCRNFDKFIIAIIFLEIALLPISFLATQQALFKTVLSRDPWFHWILVEEIVRRGHIPLYEEIPIPYVKMPNFHILIAFGMILTGVPYKWSQFLFVGLPTLLILTSTAFLLYNKIFGLKVAILSVLFVAIADNVLDMCGRNIVPNSIGVAIALTVFYLCCFKNFFDLRIKITAILISFSLVLTHTVSFSFLLYQIAVLTAISFLFRNPQSVSYLNFAVLLIVFAVFEWALYSGLYFGSLITMIKQLFVYGFDIERYESRLPTSFLDAVIARSGMILYTVFAGFFALILFIKSLKNKDEKLLVNTLSTGGILAGASSFLTPAMAGISHRFWYYGEVLGSGFIGNIISYMEKSRKEKIKPILKILSVVFLFMLALLMFKANVAADDNPIIPHYSQRTGWTDSELEAGKFIVIRQGNVPLSSDFDYSNNLNFLKTNLLASGVLEKVERVYPRTLEELYEFDCIFVFRKDMFENRLFYLGGRWSQTPQIPLKEDTKTVIYSLNVRGSNVYNNGNVLMFFLSKA